MNRIVSGIPSSKIVKSATAKLVINKLVIEVLIFLFKSTANITSEFPSIPTTPMIKNSSARPIRTSVVGPDVDVCSIEELIHSELSFSNGVDIVYSDAMAAPANRENSLNLPQRVYLLYFTRILSRLSISIFSP